MPARPIAISFTALALAVALVVGGCQRRDAPGADSVGSSASTVRAAPSQDAASTPLPVAPSGLTNSSTAAQATDLSNSTRATGSSNTYQPPSSDNPASGATPTAAASGTGQSVSSTTTGTVAPAQAKP